MKRNIGIFSVLLALLLSASPLHAQKSLGSLDGWYGGVFAGVGTSYNDGDVRGIIPEAGFIYGKTLFEGFSLEGVLSGSPFVPDLAGERLALGPSVTNLSFGLVWTPSALIWGSTLMVMPALVVRPGVSWYQVKGRSAAYAGSFAPFATVGTRLYTEPVSGRRYFLGLEGTLEYEKPVSGGSLVGYGFLTFGMTVSL